MEKICCTNITRRKRQNAFTRNHGILFTSSYAIPQNLLVPRKRKKRKRQSNRKLDRGTGTSKASLLAEEVALIYPEYVVRDKEGRLLAIQYEPFIALLIKRDQEQQAEIEALKAAQASILKRLDALEAK